MPLILAAALGVAALLAVLSLVFDVGGGTVAAALHQNEQAKLGQRVWASRQ